MTVVQSSPQRPYIWSMESIVIFGGPSSVLRPCNLGASFGRQVVRRLCLAEYKDALQGAKEDV